MNPCPQRFTNYLLGSLTPDNDARSRAPRHISTKEESQMLNQIFKTSNQRYLLPFLPEWQWGNPTVLEIVHDAEYYILEAQNGEKWQAEDRTAASPTR